jgi:hypothetical protein
VVPKLDLVRCLPYDEKVTAAIFRYRNCIRWKSGTLPSRSGLTNDMVGGSRDAPPITAVKDREKLPHIASSPNSAAVLTVQANSKIHGQFATKLAFGPMDQSDLNREWHLTRSLVVLRGCSDDEFDRNHHGIGKSSASITVPFLWA